MTRDDAFEGLSAEKEGNWVFSGAHFLHNHGVGRTSPRATFLIRPPKPWSWPGISLREEWAHPLLSAALLKAWVSYSAPNRLSPSFLVSSPGGHALKWETDGHPRQACLLRKQTCFLLINICAPFKYNQDESQETENWRIKMHLWHFQLNISHYLSIFPSPPIHLQVII